MDISKLTPSKLKELTAEGCGTVDGDVSANGNPHDDGDSPNSTNSNPSGSSSNSLNNCDNSQTSANDNASYNVAGSGDGGGDGGGGSDDNDGGDAGDSDAGSHNSCGGNGGDAADISGSDAGADSSGHGSGNGSPNKKPSGDSADADADDCYNPMSPTTATDDTTETADEQTTTTDTKDKPSLWKPLSTSNEGNLNTSFNSGNSPKDIDESKKSDSPKISSQTSSSDDVKFPTSSHNAKFINSLEPVVAAGDAEHSDINTNREHSPEHKSDYSPSNNSPENSSKDKCNFSLSSEQALQHETIQSPISANSAEDNSKFPPDEEESFKPQECYSPIKENSPSFSSDAAVTAPTGSRARSPCRAPSPDPKQECSNTGKHSITPENKMSRKHKKQGALLQKDPENLKLYDDPGIQLYEGDIDPWESDKKTGVRITIQNDFLSRENDSNVEVGEISSGEGESLDKDRVEEMQDDDDESAPHIIPISELPRIPKRKRKKEEAPEEEIDEEDLIHKSVLERLNVSEKSFSKWEKRSKEKEKRSRDEERREGREGRNYRVRESDRENVRERDNDRERETNRDRDKANDFEKSRDRDKSRDGDRSRDRERSRDHGRTRDSDRNRDIEKARDHDDDRSRRRKHRRRSRSRSRDRDRTTRDRSSRSRRSRSRSRERRRKRSRDKTSPSERSDRRRRSRDRSRDKRRSRERRHRTRTPSPRIREEDTNWMSDDYVRERPREKSFDQTDGEYKSSAKMFAKTLREAAENEKATAPSSGHKFKLQRNSYNQFQSQSSSETREVEEKNAFDSTERPAKDEMRRMPSMSNAKGVPIVIAPIVIDDDSDEPSGTPLESEVNTPDRQKTGSPEQAEEPVKETIFPVPKTPPPLPNEQDKESPPPVTVTDKDIVEDSAYDPAEPTDEETANSETVPAEDAPSPKRIPSLMQQDLGHLHPLPPQDPMSFRDVNMQHSNMQMMPPRVGLRMVQPMPPNSRPPVVVGQVMAPPFGRFPRFPARLGWTGGIPPNMMLPNQPLSQNGVPLQHNGPEMFPAHLQQALSHLRPPPPPSSSVPDTLKVPPPPLPAKALQEMQEISHLLNAQAKLVEFQHVSVSRQRGADSRSEQVVSSSSAEKQKRSGGSRGDVDMDSSEVIDMDVASPDSDDDMLMSFSPPPLDKTHHNKPAEPKEKSFNIKDVRPRVGKEQKSADSSSGKHDKVTFIVIIYFYTIPRKTLKTVPR